MRRDGSEGQVKYPRSTRARRRLPEHQSAMTVSAGSCEKLSLRGRSSHRSHHQLRPTPNRAPQLPRSKERAARGDRSAHHKSMTGHHRRKLPPIAVTLFAASTDRTDRVHGRSPHPICTSPIAEAEHIENLSFASRHLAPSASLPAGRTRLDAEGSIAPALLLKTSRSVAAGRNRRWLADGTETAVLPSAQKEALDRGTPARSPTLKDRSLVRKIDCIESETETPRRGAGEGPSHLGPADIGAPTCARPLKTFRREDLTPSSTRLLGAARWLSLGNDGRALKAPDQRSKGAAGSRRQAGRPGRSWLSARARR
uniref:Uncharacterized protein n=1 Tax=Branchiostoma floridae TaxID=7739 RepID=C3ZN69_BRAFL|eukprot:XP_002590021.1 hypothetical protein BRAFLDRAFT_81643 [Branchiostoma floridae]